MSIVCISNGSHCQSAEVAENVARKLGYSRFGTEAIFALFENFKLPEFKRTKGTGRPPSLFDSLRFTKPHTLACYRAALLKHLCGDDIVYDGPAGQFFLQDISHVLKVRVLTDFEDRVVAAMDDEGVSEAEARRILAKDDDARRQWALHAFGIDPEDQTLYDMVVHSGRIGIDGAVDLICHMVSQDSFRTTPESQATLEDMTLSAYVEALLMELEPSQIDADVTASGGEVLVRLSRTPRVRAGTSPEFQTHYVEDLRRRLLRRCIGLPGMKTVEVTVGQD